MKNFQVVTDVGARLVPKERIASTTSMSAFQTLASTATALTGSTGTSAAVIRDTLEETVKLKSTNVSAHPVSMEVTALTLLPDSNVTAQEVTTVPHVLQMSMNVLQALA